MTRVSDTRTASPVSDDISGLPRAATRHPQHDILCHQRARHGTSTRSEEQPWRARAGTASARQDGMDAAPEVAAECAAAEVGAARGYRSVPEWGSRPRRHRRESRYVKSVLFPGYPPRSCVTWVCRSRLPNLFPRAPLRGCPGSMRASIPATEWPG
jgi:hypothetical protein